MSFVHMWVGIAVIALNAAAGGLGGVSWLRREPSVIFWYLLRAAQAAVVLQALLGMALIMTGLTAPTDLHLVYGLLPLLVTLVSEALRVTAVEEDAGDTDLESLERSEQVALARRIVLREMGIMTTSALVILGLALRAYFIAV